LESSVAGKSLVTMLVLLVGPTYKNWKTVPESLRAAFTILVLVSLLRAAMIRVVLDASGFQVAANKWNAKDNNKI
jgi:hypothetical protein